MKDLAFDHWTDLLKMVLEENQRQLEKWGFQDNHPYGWMVFLTEEIGELAAAIGDKVERDNATDGDIALEAIQVATLALKIAEMHLYRRQSEAPDDLLINPSSQELKEAMDQAEPGSTITIEETIHPRFNQTPEEIIQEIVRRADEDDEED